jgi:hypothetical protein
MEHSDSVIPFLYKIILQRPPLLLTGISNNILFESGSVVAVDDIDIVVVIVFVDDAGPSLDDDDDDDDVENPCEDDVKMKQKTIRNERLLWIIFVSKQ